MLLAIPLLCTGCSSAAPPGPSVEVRGEHCKIVPGDSSELLIAATVLLPDTVITDGAVLISGSGKIGEVGLFEGLAERYESATRIDCRGNAVLTPGWVNVHEHPAYSYEFPAEALSPVYSHREEWIFGRNDKLPLPIPTEHSDYRSNPVDAAILTWVELRHLLSGTTTIGGPGAVPSITRNIGSTHDPAYEFDVDLEIFPFSTDAITEFTGHCDETGKNVVAMAEPQSERAFAPHIGEGRRGNCTAEMEIQAYLEYVAENPDASRRYSAVHAVAATPGQLRRFAELDITLVWAPRSNWSLYGGTIDLPAALRHDVRLALSTDWSPSGSFNMLEEFKCAGESFAAEELHISPKDLWSMATMNAAYAVGLEDQIGQIREGLLADLVLKRRHDDQPPYAAAVENGVDDLIAVWVGGQLLVKNAVELGDSIAGPPCNASGIENLLVCIDLVEQHPGWAGMSRVTQGAVPISGDVSGQANCAVSAY